TFGSTTVPAASGLGSQARTLLIKMAFTERRAQEPQQLFRAAAKLASFGLILPEMFGSLADSALTRPAPELPRVLFSTICGNSRRSEEHTSELQSRSDLVCRLL